MTESSPTSSSEVPSTGVDRSVEGTSPRASSGVDRYRALFEAMDTAVLLMRGPVCIDCNPAAARLFGLERREDLLGRTPLDFATPVQPNGMLAEEMIRRNIEKALVEGPQQFEWQARKADGRVFQMEVRFSSIRIGEETLFQCIASDISSRKRAEEVLRESQQELSTYHDLVTHDFANFSMTILGTLEELLGDGGGLSAPGGLVLVRRARRQAYEMNRLAENARLLARLRDGRFQSDGEPIPLDQVLAAAIETVRAVHFDREIDYRCSGAGELAAFRIPMFDNVILNLFGNAVRQSPRGKPVRIAVEIGHPRDDPRGKVVRVIGGRAPGAAELTRFFQRWSPGERSGGAGLGLSLAREIVLRAGGSITAAIGTIEGERHFAVTMRLPGALRVD